MSEEICDGVKMLIERMQTNPEDFDYGGRLHEHTNMIGELFESPKGHQRLWFLSDKEKKALMGAYMDMHRTRFTAGVVQSILSPESRYDINMDIAYKNPSKIVAPKNMLKQAKELLNKEFDKEYLKNYAQSNNTRP
jgi:hypothetical protein